MLDHGVGYVVLRRMSAGAADELRSAIDTLVAQGMTSLVLDLRSNPGGLIREGVAVAALFLEQGDTVASSVGRSWKRPKTYLAEAPCW
jgi:carboxyl-terminal processing protease